MWAVAAFTYDYFSNSGVIITQIGVMPITQVLLGKLMCEHLKSFHGQSVAIEGRSAIAQKVTNHLGEMGSAVPLNRVAVF